MDHDYGDVYEATIGAPTGEHTITLADGDSAPAPGTTKKAFYGPGSVTYGADRATGLRVVSLDGAQLRYIPRT